MPLHPSAFHVSSLLCISFSSDTLYLVSRELTIGCMDLLLTIMSIPSKEVYTKTRNLIFLYLYLEGYGVRNTLYFILHITIGHKNLDN